MILKDKEIDYSNQIFKDVLKSMQIEMKEDEPDREILDMKLLKVYYNKETSNKDSTLINGSDEILKDYIDRS